MKNKSGSKSMILLLSALFMFLIYGMFFSSCGKNPVLENTSEAEGESASTIDHGDKVMIMLDAAYGGDLTGYTGIVNEADLNANIVEAIKAKFEEDNRFMTVLTHEKNESKAVLDKAAFISENNPALFITICAANDKNSETSGMHIYADKPDAETAEESLKLAEAIQSQFSTKDTSVDVKYRYYESIGNNTYQIRDVSFEDKEPKKMNTWLILEETNAVGVVVEQMYVTNQSEIDRWTSPEGLNEIAEAYYKAVCDYLGLK